MNLLEEIKKNNLDTKKVVTRLQMSEAHEMVGKFCNHQPVTVSVTDAEDSGCTPPNFDEPPANADSHGKVVDFSGLAKRLEAEHMDSRVVDHIDEALFIFAWDMIRETPDEGFMAMGHRFVPHWRQHLPQEAFAVLVAKIKMRLAGLEQQSGQ